MLKLLRRMLPGKPMEPVAEELSEWEQMEQSIEELLRSQQPNRLENLTSGWYNEDTRELYGGFHLSSDDTVVDVGCGDGPVSAFCAKHCAEYIFADIDAATVASIYGKMRDKPATLYPLVSDANPLPLVDGIATRVIAREVLEHVDDPEQFMAELVRIGKPGARYLITVPGYLHESVQKDLAPPGYFEKPNHIRIFQPGELEQLIQAAGLSVEESSSRGFYWSMWWYLFWACDQDLSEPWHPILKNWSRTWFMLLETEQGPRIKRVLDDIMPKSVAVVASKTI